MTDEYISSLTKESVLEDETFFLIFEIENQLDRAQKLVKLKQKARSFGVSRDFDFLLKGWQMEFAQKYKQAGSNRIDFIDSPLPNLHCGKWIANDTGVTRQEIISGFQPQTKVACTHPIQPVERLINRDTETEKIKLAFFKDFRWQAVTVARSVCADKGMIVRNLADRGIEVNSKTAGELSEYISDVVSLNAKEIPAYEAVSRTGWVGNDFAPYDNAVKYDGDGDFRGLYDAVSENGDYESWKSYCTNLRKKSIYLRIQMAASFASVLIEKVGALPFVLHLWGLTGKGKTVGMMVAMSIWGNPAMGGLVRTMNMTANSMASTASFLYSIPFAGDELQIIKSNWDDNYDKIIMYVCEGIDRGRNTSRNAIEKLKVWKNSFLFTGEEPVTKAQSGGGVKNRVIEIGAKTAVVENGNDVVNFITENYGFAGKEFVNVIKKEIPQQRYKEIFKSILEECDTTEKQAMAMAMMMLADEIAVKHIFTSEQPLKIGEIRQFLTSESDVDVAKRAYDWSLNWIAKNRVRFHEVENSGEIWGRIDEDFALINRDVYAEHLSKAGFEYSAVIGKLAEREQIIRNSQSKYVHQTHVFGVRASYVKLVIPSKIDSIDLPF